MVLMEPAHGPAKGDPAEAASLPLPPFDVNASDAEPPTLDEGNHLEVALGPAFTKSVEHESDNENEGEHEDDNGGGGGTGGDDDGDFHDDDDDNNDDDAEDDEDGVDEYEDEDAKKFRENSQDGKESDWALPSLPLPSHADGAASERPLDVSEVSALVSELIARDPEPRSHSSGTATSTTSGAPTSDRVAEALRLASTVLEEGCLPGP